MKKILYIHHSAGWGGSASSLIKLIKNLDVNKYQAEVLLLKHSIIADRLSEFGVKYSIASSSFYKKYYEFFPHSEAGYIKWFQIFSFFKLSILWLLSHYKFAGKELANYSPDIIHLNSSVLTDWLAPAKRKGRVIMHIREPFRKGKFDLLHWFFRSEMKKYSDKIVAISKDNASRIHLPEKTQIVYNYAEVPINDPSIESYSSKKALYLGGVSTSKGFYTLVDALKYLNNDVIIYFGGNYKITSRPRLTLHFLRYYFSRARKRNSAIQKIMNNTNSKIIGMVEDIDSYYNEVCCHVSPFQVPHFSRPVIESHLHKKPAIGSNVEGMDEIIEHKKNGLIVPKNDPKALAEAINSLTADGKEAERLGLEGYKTAVQKFTPRNILQIENIYDMLYEEI